MRKRSKPAQNRFRWGGLGLAAGIIFTAIFSSCHGRKAENAVPVRDANIVLITVDTTRADHLSCYAPGGAKTPNLDALAARGVRFAQATAQVPLTLPSHASIMTGTYPTVHGLRDMGGFVLAPTHPTLASVLRSRGFATGAVVGSRILSRTFGLAQGFTFYDDKIVARLEENALPGLYPERRASEVTDHAIGWLEQNSASKFFFWAHYYDPHHPYDPPAPFSKTYAKDLYSGEIAYTDQEVGRLLQWIDQHALSARTLIVVMGDHGESLGQHGELTHGIFLYDATLHVPFIMAGPDVPSGKVIEDQVRSIDVLPTVLDFLHITPPQETQGVSLWPLIDAGRHVRSNYSYAETLYPRTYMGWSELRAMRTDNWKLIIAPHPELYNLTKDPNETDNVISHFPADADELQKKIWEVAGVPGKTETVSTVPVNGETRQELESLGYVSAGTPREIKLGTAAPDPKDEIGVMKELDECLELTHKNQYARALQLAADAFKKDPTNPMAVLYLARSYEKLGQFAHAGAVYEDAIGRHIGTDLMYSRLGKIYLRLHEIDKAVAAMVAANQINPTDLDNLRNLGTAYLQLNKVEDAERAFRAIIVQNDQYAAAYNGLGLVAIQRGDASTAAENFKRAVDMDPTDMESLFNLGVLYQKLGDREKAIHYLSAFVERAPRSQYAQQIQDVKEAIADLKKGSS
jgi:choline-sulfatase